MMKWWRNMADDYFDKIITENDIMCLDIEVSSFWVYKNKVTVYDSSLPDKFYNDARKASCVYIWMFSINDDIYFGREWQDFKEFLLDLRRFCPASLQKEIKKRCYIYVHNLAYEFQFLRNLFKMENVFARSERKPMKFTFDIFEFRCSYQLTHMSLASWGKEIGTEKKVGDLDYLTLRTPLTVMTEKELGYCEYDIRVMIAGLKKYLEKYGSIKKIPMTQTGELRRVVKEIFKDDKQHHFHVTKLQPKSVEFYAIAKQIFAGGDTSSNPYYVGMILYNAGSFDETSAYPFEMVGRKYPWTKFQLTLETEERWDFEQNAYIIHCTYYNIKSTSKLIYMSSSRCTSVIAGIYANGRVVSADVIDVWFTEQDYEDFERHYAYESRELHEVYKSRKRYLPTPFVQFILKVYSDKTTLKGVKGMEDLYLRRKQQLNSLYGMAVTDIIQPEVIYDENGWDHKRPDREMLEEALAKVQKQTYNNNLAYVWGIWVTAYARSDLWWMLDAVMAESIEPNGDALYYDTDSCKMLHPEEHMHIIEERNHVYFDRLVDACAWHQIDFNLCRPRDKKGQEHMLGFWDNEAADGCVAYKRFKSLGAKKYMYEDEEGLHLTISGVPKKAVACMENGFDDFERDFYFDRDICGKHLTTYLDGTNWSGRMPDGYDLNQPYGINLRNIGYRLDITQQFRDTIELLRGGYI